MPRGYKKNKMNNGMDQIYKEIMQETGLSPKNELLRATGIKKITPWTLLNACGIKRVSLGGLLRSLLK